MAGTVAGVAEGDELAAGQRLHVPEGAQVTLDYARGARVVLLGPALAQAMVEPLDGLLLEHGIASIDLPPAATTPDSGFWTAAPTARIDIVRGARVALRAFPGGELTAFMVSGSASLVRGAGQPLGRAESLLVPGELARARLADVQRSQLGATTLELAVAKLQTLRARGSEDTHQVLDRALVQLGGEVQEAIDRESGLVRAHRASLHAADAAAMTLQADLSRHAAVLAGLKGRLRTLLAQRSAARLGLPAGTSDPPGEKAHALLGGAP